MRRGRPRHQIHSRTDVPGRRGPMPVPLLPATALHRVIGGRSRCTGGSKPCGRTQSRRRRPAALSRLAAAWMWNPSPLTSGDPRAFPADARVVVETALYAVALSIKPREVLTGRQKGQPGAGLRRFPDSDRTAGCHHALACALGAEAGPLLPPCPPSPRPSSQLPAALSGCPAPALTMASPGAKEAS